MASKKTTETTEVTPEEVTSIEETPTETPAEEAVPQIELNTLAPQREDPGHKTRAFRS